MLALSHSCEDEQQADLLFVRFVILMVDDSGGSDGLSDG